MYKRLLVRGLAAVAAVALVAVGGAASAAENAENAETTGSSAGFVTRAGADLEVDGKTFRFAGSNNYYLHYSSPAMVDDVFGDAAAAGFNVLRTWGFMEAGQNG